MITFPHAPESVRELIAADDEKATVENAAPAPIFLINDLLEFIIFIFHKQSLWILISYCLLQLFLTIF